MNVSRLRSARAGHLRFKIPSWPGWPVFVALLYCLLPAEPAAAQLPSAGRTASAAATSAAEDTGPGTTEGAAKQRREAFRQRLAHLEASAAKLREANPPRQPAPHLLTEIELLKYLELLFAQQDAARSLRQELGEEKAALQAHLEQLRNFGPSESKPYSFLLLDDLRNQLATEVDRRESIDAEIEAARALLESVRQLHDDHERQRRLARDAVETNRDPDADRSLAEQLEQAKLRSEVTHEAILLRTAEIENFQLRRELSELKVKYLEEKVALVAPETVFSEADLQVCLSTLQQEEQQLKQELDRAREELQQVERRWLDARQAVQDADGQDPVAAEKVVSWQLVRGARNEEVKLLNQRLAEIVLMRFFWNARFKVVNNTATPDDMEELRDDAKSFVDRMHRARKLVEIQLRQQRTDLPQLQKRLAVHRGRDPELAKWIEFQLQTRQRLINAYGTNLSFIEARERLLAKVLEELSADEVESPAAFWLSQTTDVLATAWNYEIASIDDRPITVKKLVGGCALLLAGYVVARLISRLLGRRVLPRFGLDEGVSTALQTIAFYTLFATVGFLSLEIINLPLTVFTFMGGAIAIGVGFGSQNVLNNFISGLILLAERPIRVGDLVDIGGLYGTIEHIGARSTRVKTGANLEIIVPNSKFLENNVTNWTLSDTRIRTMVAVGVAYGSPTREVTRLLRQAVVDHPSVLGDPEPIVLFKDFGDNSLNFEVHFWIHMRTVMQGQRIASDIRHTIDELFAQANITIAFPQRDVHIDTLKPLEINVRSLGELRGQPFSEQRAA